MQILFTKNSTVLSKTIRDLTNEPVSHTVLLFDFKGVEFVIHVNLLGLRIDEYDSFLKTNQIVCRLEPQLDSYLQNMKDNDRLKTVLKQYKKVFYDLGALLFAGSCLLMRRWFKIPLPKSNLWQMSGMLLCTEWIQSFIDIPLNAMITPYQLYLELKKSAKWFDVRV